MWIIIFFMYIVSLIGRCQICELAAGQHVNSLIKGWQDHDMARSFSCPHECDKSPLTSLFCDVAGLILYKSKADHLLMK